jgi:hypothetical protein
MGCSQQRLRLSAGAAALVAALVCYLVLPCSAAAARLQVSARRAQRLNAAEFHAGVAAGMQQLMTAAAATSGSGAFALATAAGIDTAGAELEATSGTAAKSDLHAGAAASMQQILEYVAAGSLASADAGDAGVTVAANAAERDAEVDLHAGIGMTMRGLAKLVSARAAAAGRLPVRRFATAAPGTSGLDAGVAASMQQLRELAVSQSDLAAAAEGGLQTEPVSRAHIPARLME